MKMIKSNLIIFVIYAYLIQSLYTSAIINENEHRVHDHKLSDHEHYTDKDHDNNMEHNSEYDHEAFLGKEDAEKFKKLTPAESRQRLAEIYDKIDVDKDGFVTETELHNWIKNVSKIYLKKDVEKRWSAYDTNNTGSFTLERMLDVNYGALDFWSEEEKEKKKDDYKIYMKLKARDTDRFKAADADHDGKLTKSEYSDFLHPEEAPHMHDIVVTETLEDLDKNGDGFIDVEEFIVDIYPDKQDPEPDWVKNERINFAKYRDANGDGKLDRDEISNWILPPDYDHTIAEAKHLIYEADANEDEKLTKDEVLNKSSVFVSSQATLYGEAVNYKHEDL